MANPSVLTEDTILYSPAEPEGRQFYAGETWPGDAWSTKPGGGPVGSEAAAAALKEVDKANARLEQMSRMALAKDHDLGVMAGERDAANLTVADLESRALTAEKAQAAAEASAHGYMQERDTAREALKKATDKLAQVSADLTAAKAEAAKVEGLVEQLAAAEQRAADLQTQLDAANAPAKPKKAAKDDAAGAGDAPAAPKTA